MGICIFFGAAAIGFALMFAVGLHALIALLSSIPLAREHHRANPAFDLHRAYRRIFRVVLTSLLIMIVATALVIHFTRFFVTVGYFLGMIFALLISIQRMTPNNARNQAGFETRYSSCYPHHISDDQP